MDSGPGGLGWEPCRYNLVVNAQRKFKIKSMWIYDHGVCVSERSELNHLISINGRFCPCWSSWPTWMADWHGWLAVWRGWLNGTDGWMAGWFVWRLARWLAGWLAGLPMFRRQAGRLFRICLVWSDGWMVGWLAGWFGWLVGWMTGCLGELLVAV